MGPSDNAKLALGLFTATGIVAVSYFLLKKIGDQPKKGKKPPPDVETVQASQAVSTQSAAPPVEVSQLGGGDVPPIKAESPSLPVVEEPPPSLDGDNQTSYIFISGQESLENGAKKASDRSSDESSYDVIEDEEKERMEQDVAEAEEQGDQGPLKDVPAESSMIIVDDVNLNKSGGEMSSSSFYTSADELVDSPVKESDKSGSVEEESGEGDDNATNNAKDSEEDSVNLTVINSESKSEGSGNEEPSKSPDESTGDSSFLSLGTTESENVSQVSDSAGPGGDEQGSAEAQKETQDVKIVPVTEAVLTPTSGTEAASEEAPAKLKPDEIAEILTSISNAPGEVTVDQLSALISVLSRDDLASLRPLVLDNLVKVTSFSQNNSKLRSAGLPEAIAAMTVSECEAVTSAGVTEENKVLPALCHVLTNLTLDPENSLKVQEVISPLANLLVVEQAPELLLRSLFQPLINFSSDDKFHPKLTMLVQRLFDLLDNGPASVKIQCLRILVNLSLNNEVVPNVLAAKSPQCFPGLLDETTPGDLILRSLTLLFNLESAIASEEITASSLPVEDKAESPNTVFSALTGVDSRPTLRNKVFALTQHSDEDIRTNAGKLHQVITATPDQQPTAE